MSDLVSGPIGPEAKYDIKIEAGKLSALVDYEGADMGGSVEVHIGLVNVLNAIEAKYPNIFVKEALEAAKIAIQAA